MQYTIALAGKGGTGKTTMAGLLSNTWLKKTRRRFWQLTPTAMLI